VIDVNNLNYVPDLFREQKNFFTLLLCAGFTYALFLPDATVYFLVTVMIIAAVSMIFTVHDSTLRNILMAGLTIRLFLVFIQAYSGIDLPGAGADSMVYEKTGWAYAQAWLSGSQLITADAYYYYSAIIGACYYFLGRVPLLPLFINLIFGMFCIIYIYKIINLLSNSRRASLFAALIAAFFPTLNFYSAILLREIIIIFFVLLSFYHFLLWLKTGNALHMIISFGSILLYGIFHGLTMLISWVQLCCFGIFSPQENRFKITMKHLALIVFLIIGLVVLLNLNVIAYKSPKDLLELASIESFQAIVGERNIGRTHYLDDLIPQNYFDVIWHTPIRMFYFMFAPFPWKVKTAADLFFLSDVLIYLFLIYYSFAGFKRLYNNHKVAAVSMLLIILSIVVLFGWGTVNYGTAWRHRAKVAPFLIVMASVGLAASPRLKWVFRDGKTAYFE